MYYKTFQEFFSFKFNDHNILLLPHILCAIIPYSRINVLSIFSPIARYEIIAYSLFKLEKIYCAASVTLIEFLEWISFQTSEVLVEVTEEGVLSATVFTVIAQYLT